MTNQLDVTPTRDDWRAAAEYYESASGARSLRRSYWLVVLILGLAAMVVGAVSGYDPDYPRASWIAIVLVAAVLIRTCWKPMMKLKEAPVTRMPEQAMPPFTLRVTDEGLVQTFAEGETRLGWQEIESIGDEPTHVFIRLSGRRLLFVPKRAFGDPSDAARFVDALLKRIASPPAAV